MTTANVQIIPKLVKMFTVPYGSVDYRIAHGGRGSGKTMSFAKMVVIQAYIFAATGTSGGILCAREFVNSLEDSTLAEIKAAIQSEEWLVPWFDVGEKYVRTRNLPGRVDFIFAGLRHNLDSLKSKARILLTWVDEAESVAEVAWRKLIPTVMRFGGEIWCTYNPESVDSATHKRFRANASERILIEQVNYNDNPWFPDALERERQDDYKYRPETAGHIWEGDFLTLTEAQVFAGKFRQEAMEPPEGATPYFGLDFGFSNDPFAAVRIYKIGRVLLWRREAYKKGVLIHRLGDEVRKGLGDDVARYDIIADSSRPDDIGYLKQPINVSGGSFQLPRIKASVKGKGSVEAGVEFIKSHDNVIHPDCPNTFKEFKLYQYKVDKQSGSVLPVLLDSYNHCMVAGTMVATGRGDVPIEEVTSDDHVMTREGLRRVKFAGATGIAKRVLKVSTTNGDFTCTPGHRVYTSNGFVRADSLCAGDELTALEETCGKTLKRSSGTVKPTAGIHQAVMRATERISSGPPWVEPDTCTGPFGLMPTAQYLMGTTSITLMAMRPTTLLKISCSSHLNSTASITKSGAEGLMKRERTLTGSGISLLNGTQQKREGSFTPQTENLFGRSSSQSNCSVSNADQNTRKGMSAALKDSARTHVSQRGEDRPELITSSSPAPNADVCLSGTNTVKPSVVPARVLTVTDAGIADLVYDISVDGEPEFFANGLLVHNCIDAARYALEPILRNQKFNWAAVS